MRSMFLCLSIAAGALCVAPPAMAVNTLAPDPSSVVVDPVTVNGTGCPAGDGTFVFGGVNADGSYSISVAYGDQLVAHSSPNTKPAEQLKDCVLSFLVHAVPGWQFSIAHAYNTGHLTLDKGVFGLQKTRYFLNDNLDEDIGSTDDPVTRKHLVGPLDKFFFREDEAGNVWSQCGVDTIAHIDDEVAAVSPIDPATHTRVGEGWVVSDFTFDIRIKWQKC